MAPSVQPNWIEQALTALNEEGSRRLIEFLERQRWFGGKGKPLAAMQVLDAIVLAHNTDRRLLALVGLQYRGGSQERYVLPLAIRPAQAPEDAQAIVALPGADSEWVCDATHDAATWISLYQDMAQGRERGGESGCLLGRSILHGQEEWSEPVREATVLSAEQSNTSAVLDRRVILKLLRKLETGIHPDSEMLEFLTTRTACPYVPALLGLVTYEDRMADEAQPATVAILQRFVTDSLDGWKYTLAHLETLLSEGPAMVEQGRRSLAQAVGDLSGQFLKEMRRLGDMTGELHLALASQQEPEAFRPESITSQDVEQWQAKMIQHLAAVCRDLRTLQPDQRSAAGLSDQELAALETACRGRFGDLQLLPRSGASKIRAHGDYHLGQVLKTPDGFVVIDFEGEPARPLDERRAKLCPLKDVGGMLRSFSYAAQVLLRQRRTVSATETGLMTTWERMTRAAFLDGYCATTRPGQALFLPAGWEEALRVIKVYELDKALYEVRYELRNRPDWLSIPVSGVRLLVEGEASTSG